MFHYNFFNSNHFKLRRFTKMRKPPNVVTDSETEDTNSCSSIDYKAKKTFSILKYTKGNVKKKFTILSKSEPDDSDYRSKCTRSRSNQRVGYKLPGILKKQNNNSNRETSEDEDEIETFVPSRPQYRYLVGTVPRPAGANPGRGGGLAIVVKKNISCVQGPQNSSLSSPKRRNGQKGSWLSRKRSY